MSLQLHVCIQPKRASTPQHVTMCILEFFFILDRFNCIKDLPKCNPAETARTECITLYLRNSPRSPRPSKPVFTWRIIVSADVTPHEFDEVGRLFPQLGHRFSSLLSLRTFRYYRPNDRFRLG